MIRLILAACLLAIAWPAQAKHHHHKRIHHRYAPDPGDPANRIVDHPAGCPHTAFCGCGASVRIFGAPIRELFLAANWFRFPRAAPAAGMVAVRRHHVFVIEDVLPSGRVLAYDPNSGGHLTRLHVALLAGYRVVNPRGH